MKRLLPFVVLIVLILASIFSIPFLLRPESHRAEITDRLSKLLKHPVLIGPLSMTYWPPSLNLGQVAVIKEAGNPALEIESVEAVLDWASLFRLQMVPSELRLKHPVLSAQRQMDGRWDLEGWLAGASGLSNVKTGSVQKVSWTAGEIHGRDRFASAPQELVLGSLEGNWDPQKETLTVSGGFTGIGAPARLSLNAKGQFFSSPEWSGDAQISDEGRSGTFHIEKHAGKLDVKGGSPQWSLANALALAKFYARASSASAGSAGALVLENWQIHAVAENGRTTFEQTAGLSGGLSEIKARVETQPAGPVVHLDVALKEAPAEAVLSALGENLLFSGKVTALAKDVEITLSTHTLGTLKGSGYWELKAGRYRLPEVSLKKLAKAKTMAYLKKKFPDLETQGVPVDKLSAHWQAKEGLLLTEDGLFVTSDIKAGWTGKLDAVRRGFDGYVRLQLLEKDPALARLIPAKYKSRPAFGRVQGSWDEWSLRALPASKIPSAAQAKLRKAIK